jgi:lipoprotein-anchoring transpeptidase ErfK/SrfK
VPNYPASHGCLRIPIPNARFVFDWINLGDQIFVYR